MALATMTASRTFGERLSAFADRLESAIEGPACARFPDELFSDSEYDAHSWYREFAERVAATFEASGYEPDLDVLTYGLIDFAMQSTAELTRVDGGDHEPEIQAGLVELAIQVLARTRAADGTKHASRSRGNRLRNLYLERMRPAAIDPVFTSRCA